MSKRRPGVQDTKNSSQKTYIPSDTDVSNVSWRRRFDTGSWLAFSFRLDPTSITRRRIAHVASNNTLFSTHYFSIFK